MTDLPENSTFPSQLDALRRELRDSQAAQNWAPGSTRSQWADDLANILDLHDRISIALDEAQEKQARLTTKVAKRLAEDAVALADACDGPEVDRLDDTLPIPELVAAIREQGIRIEGWDRDGFIVTPGEAYAFATMRSIDPYQDPGYVTVDLLDGEVEVRIP